MIFQVKYQDFLVFPIVYKSMTPKIGKFQSRM